MSTPRDPAAELEQLLMALVDGELSHVQQQHLAALLRNDPTLQAKYSDYLLLDALLRWEQPEAASPAPRRPVRRWQTRIAWAAVTVAAGLLVAVGAWFVNHGQTVDTPEILAEPTDNSVAVLIQAPGAVWDPADPPRRNGSPLAAGPLRLLAGFAHIEFYSGATVILEGPAALELISRTAAHCTSGKLRATVPPQAQGFTISTPQMDVVDRGTEFGLRVDGEDKAEVHVFQGKVDMYGAGVAGAGPARTELRTGEGVRVAGQGVPRPIASDPDGFETAEGLTARAQKEVQRRKQEWAVASESLRRDPTLVLYYPFQFDEDEPRTLHGHARPGRPGPGGAIVGCTWASGRWPGKQGLEFRRVSDRVRLNLPGEFESITLAAWVRVDGLPNLNNALLLTDGWEPGGVHWQIGEAGKLVLGIQSPRGVRGANYHAFGVFTPERFGQWTHLAVVYDRTAGQVTHYVDGQPVAQVPTVSDVPLRIGDAEIGNWNIANHKNNNPIRHFTGCMDEFMLFARAMDDAEVGRLYATGRPPA